MNYKPITIARWLFLSLSVFLFTAAFAFEVTTRAVNDLEPNEALIEQGGELFQSNCASCHALDARVVGPALGGVLEKYEDDAWLLAWIKNNNKLRQSGDERANAIYNEYKGSPMQVFENLSDNQINSILLWIGNGGTAEAAPAAVEAPVQEVDESLFGKINWGMVLMFLLVGVIMLMIFGILELVSNITGKQVINWNNVNAYMMLIFLVVFFALVIYEFKVHGAMLLPESASAHGVELDKMMYWTYICTIPVFFITQLLLFWFSFKYREKPGKKAFYYPHNNNLELVWTIIPAIVLAALVSKGFITWNNILRTNEDAVSAEHIEVFAYQFGWYARYAGEDGELGKANYNLINGTNPLGVANRKHAEELINELKEEIVSFEEGIERLPKELGKLESTLGGLVGDERSDRLSEIGKYKSGEKQSELELLIRARNTQIMRLTKSLEAKNGMYTGAGDDDQVVQEIHLVENKPVTLKFRARDVIHSAYLPYFRTQMNVVPGLPTEFTFTPIISTNSMRQIKGDPEFDYYLVCNKICGNAHFNMKMKVVVEDEVSYKKWMAEQKALFAAPAEETEDAEQPAEDEEEEENTESPEELIAQNN